MKLISATVSGFRNLAETHLELGGITALVAANNFGKTNLLDAIEFGADFINANPPQRRAMMSDASRLPLNPKLDTENYSFTLEFESSKEGPTKFIKYGFSFSWIRDDESGCRIVDEFLEMNSKRGGRWTSYINRKQEKFRGRPDTRSMRSLSLDGFTLAIDIIPSIKDIEIGDVVKAIKNAVVLVCRSLDTSSRFSSSAVEIGQDFVLPGTMMFDDKDLPRSLFALKETSPNRFNEFLSAIYELFPTFEKVSVDTYELPGEVSEALHASFDKTYEESNVPFRIRDDQYRITITDSTLNQPVDISRMSTGTKRTFWLIANIIIAQSGNVSCLGIEEIEAGIHPRMIHSLLDILSEQVNDTALIVSSHSPYLIQYLKPAQIYIGIPSDDGVARFASLHSTKLELAIDLAFRRGMSLGEYLFDLLTSDYEGKKTLNELIGG